MGAEGEVEELRHHLGLAIDLRGAGGPGGEGHQDRPDAGDLGGLGTLAIRDVDGRGVRVEAEVVEDTHQVEEARFVDQIVRYQLVDRAQLVAEQRGIGREATCHAGSGW